MAAIKVIFSTKRTYACYGEEATWGTPATTVGTNYVDKVTSFTGRVANNMMRRQGMGEGLNATAVANGGVDVTGNMAWELTDPAFLQYCVLATKTGVGTLADPYELKEAPDIGYGSGEVKPLTIEVGRQASSVYDTVKYDGWCVNSWEVSGSQGDTVKGSCEWVARSCTSSAAVLTYTAPTNRPFCFVDGNVKIGSNQVNELQSFRISGTNSLKYNHSFSTRLISQPVATMRRYDFSITIKQNKDTNTGIVDSKDLRGFVFTGAAAGTTPNPLADNASSALHINLVEGAASTDRVLAFELESAYFDENSESVEFDNGTLETTITGFALSGQTDVADKVFCRWYTIS